MNKRKIPSFSSLVGLSSRESVQSAPESSDAGSSGSEDERRPRSSSRRRFSDYFKARSPSPAVKRVSLDLEQETFDEATDAEEVSICPSNSFVDTEQEDDESSEDSAWDELEKNTEANAGQRTTDQVLLDQELENPDLGPNLIHRVLGNSLNHFTPRRKKTLGGTNKKEESSFPLEVGKPVFERNRAYIVVTRGHPDEAAKNAKRTRSYLVASDLSEESLYAIEWTIGTVLRNGDACIIVSVMETDTKFDPDPGSHNIADKLSRIKYQKDRQETALRLSKEAISLLERTRLDVRVTCQAIHAKNARHMLIDMIDYVEPTMVVIGSRGLSAIKGMLLGSVSNYLVQKSSVPVMVARRRLKRRVHASTPRYALNHNPRVPLEQATIEKETHGTHTKSTAVTLATDDNDGDANSKKNSMSDEEDEDRDEEEDPGVDAGDEDDTKGSKASKESTDTGLSSRFKTEQPGPSDDSIVETTAKRLEETRL